MRLVAITAEWLSALLLVGSTVAGAQESAPSPRSDAVSMERVRATLEHLQAVDTGAATWSGTKPDGFDWGVLRFVPPTSPSEFVAVRIPVGDLATRLAKHVVTAQRHRAENAAHAQVLKALADFENAQPK